MQPVGSVVFNLFNSDLTSANSRLRCVQSQGCNQSNRRVYENKDAIPLMPRDVSSTLTRKAVGWIPSLNLGNIKPVLFTSTLVTQLSSFFAQAIPESEWSSSTTRGKIMAITNCSSETASEILESVMKSAEGCDNCSYLQKFQFLSLGAVASIGAMLMIGGVFVYKSIPAIRERLSSDSNVHLPAETPCSDEPKICSDVPKTGMVQ